MKQSTKAIKHQGSDLYLEIHLQPKASRDAVIGLYGERLKVTITAPPVDGKANNHLIEFLAKYFSVPKRSVQMIRGEHSRDKTILILSPAIPIDFKKYII